MSITLFIQHFYVQRFVGVVEFFYSLEQKSLQKLTVKALGTAQKSFSWPIKGLSGSCIQDIDRLAG